MHADCLMKDETGKTFGRLKVLRRDPKRRGTGTYWKCLCSCGKKISAYGVSLRNGSKRSCGCLRFKYGVPSCERHGMSGSFEYFAWLAMRQRCSDKKYVNYAGRGIKVCKRWRDSFMNFFTDMGYRPAGLSLDRKNNDGDYTPKNCWWATSKYQSNNQRPRSHYRLKRTDAESIRALYRKGNIFQREIGEMFGIKKNHVGRIVRGEAWA